MSLISIKPCPFCGEEAEIIEFSDRFQCGRKDEGCIAWAEDMPVYLTRSGAIKEWNTRAYQDEPALLTKVKSLIDHLEREADSAEVAYVHYGDAEDRAEHCAYKDAARRLREIAEGKSDA